MLASVSSETMTVLNAYVLGSAFFFAALIVIFDKSGIINGGVHPRYRDPHRGGSGDGMGDGFRHRETPGCLCCPAR